MADQEAKGAEEAKRETPVWVKPVVFCAILLALALVTYASGLADGLSTIAQWDALITLVEENLPAALLIYFVCTVVGCAALMLPGMIFALAAGALFGAAVGTVACSVSTTVGAVGAFLIGRFFLHDAVKPWVCKNEYVRRWLFEETGTNAVVLLMVTRLVPLFPYNLQNYAYGITDMKLGTYTICSLIFMLPGTMMYVFIGAGISEGSGSAWLIAVSALIALATFAIAGLLQRRYLDKGGQEGADGAGKED